MTDARGLPQVEFLTSTFQHHTHDGCPICESAVIDWEAVRCYIEARYGKPPEGLTERLVKLPLLPSIAERHGEEADHADNCPLCPKLPDPETEAWLAEDKAPRAARRYPAAVRRETVRQLKAKRVRLHHDEG